MKDLYDYYEFVELCRVERDNVRDLNRPIMLENRRIRERNKELKGELNQFQYEAKREEIKPLPYSLRPNVAGVLRKEIQIKKELYNRSSEEWLVMVKSIEDEVLQTRVACIVWWDYFGKDERVGDYSDLLDHYLTRRYVEIPLDDMIRGMVAVGYSAHHAIMRLTKAEDSRE